MSQVFYRKWRPQTLAEVVGQEPITRTLLNALASGRVAHAYLFFGPRGTGKTSTGRILAKAVNCLTNGQGEPCNTCSLCRAITEGQALDLIEIDAASNRGIDEIRDLREKVNFAPNMARYKVYIIDEVHMLTEPAFNALLKTLEEPPKHVIFVLATTEVHKVPATILSRCQRFDFRRISFPAVVQRLGYICEKEGIEFEPAALEFIAQNASGSLRDAENLLEQLAIYYGSPISLSQVQALLGVTGDARIPELAKHILRKDLTGGLATLHAIGRDGLDLRQLTRELIQYLRKALLLKAGSPEVADLAAETIAALKPTIDEASLEDIAQAIKLLNQADRLEDTLPLELALVECALPKVPEVSPPPSKMMMEPKASPPPSKVVAEQKALPRQPREAMKEAAASHSIAPEPKPQEIPSPPIDDPAPTGLEGSWKRVVESLRGVGNKKDIGALLRNSCAPLALEDDTVVLGFYWAFHKDMIEEVENRLLVEEALTKVLGAPHRVRCVLTPRNTRKPSPLMKAAIDMGAKVVNTQRGEKDE